MLAKTATRWAVQSNFSTRPLHCLWSSNNRGSRLFATTTELLFSNYINCTKLCAWQCML